MARELTNEEAAAKRFEVNELFTPSTPVTVAELFAARPGQMVRIIDAVAERGRHVILYGERGVGKTSLVQILPYLIPRKERVKYCRVQAYPTDTFDTIARRILKQVRYFLPVDDGSIQEFDASQTYKEPIGPDDVLTEFLAFRESHIPVIVIDEFNEVEDQEAPTLVANTVKALSDAGANVTIIVVGVADNVTQLINRHESIQRCTEEVLMPRMEKPELLEVLAPRLRQLGFAITGDAKWKIIGLAKGLPSYVHSLGKHACLSALSFGRLHIHEDDVNAGIDGLLASSDQTFKDTYDAATRSNQPGTLLKQVLTACALAKTDESGFFTPASVKEPLSDILGRSVEIATFQNHLKAFIDPTRKAILERVGEQRAYRFRFRKPAMQPFVLMKGMREGIIDIDAKQFLSMPEEPDLFASE